MRKLIPIILGCLFTPVAALAAPAFTGEIQGYTAQFQPEYSSADLEPAAANYPDALDQHGLADTGLMETGLMDTGLMDRGLVDTGQAALLNTLLTRARSQLNSMYHFGGTSPEQGFDCSGFVGWIYHGVLRTELPRVADDIYKIDAPRIAATQLAPGDLMFYRITGSRISHVTMYVGDRHFIHATRAGQPLRIESMDMPYWRQRFAGAKRILGTPLLKAQYQVQYQANN